MSYKQVLLLFCLAFFQSNYVSAQADQPILKTVFFHDGSVFRGTVIAEKQSYLILVASTGDTLHIDKSLILERPKKLKTTKFHYTNGIFASFDVNLPWFKNDPQVDLIVGYRLNDKYSVGIGVGSYSINSHINGLWVGNTFNPIYAYGRRYIAPKLKNKPFIFLKAGYGVSRNTGFNSFNNQNVSHGGPFAEPGIGLHLASRNKFRMILSVSQYFQYASGNQSFIDNFSNPVDIDYSVLHSQFNFKIGIEFR